MMPAEFNPARINARTVCDIFDCSPHVLRGWISDGLPHEPGKRGASHTFSAPVVYRWLLERATRRNDDEGLDAQFELAALRKTQRELLEIRKQEASRELLPADDAVRAWSAVLVMFRNRMLLVPQRLRSRVPDMPGEVFDELMHLVREALTELSRSDPLAEVGIESGDDTVSAE